MRVNMVGSPLIPEPKLELGNVYRCKGGKSYNEKFWLVVGLPRDRAVMLGIDAEGNIVYSGKYGQFVFDPTNQHFHRELVGKCSGLDELQFSIDWIA